MTQELFKERFTVGYARPGEALDPATIVPLVIKLLELFKSCREQQGTDYLVQNATDIRENRLGWRIARRRLINAVKDDREVEAMTYAIRRSSRAEIAQFVRELEVNSNPTDFMTFGTPLSDSELAEKKRIQAELEADAERLEEERIQAELEAEEEAQRIAAELDAEEEEEVEESEEETDDTQGE